MSQASSSTPSLSTYIASLGVRFIVTLVTAITEEPMNAARAIVGALVLFFLGIPALGVVIWATGVTNAVVSEEFLSEIPKEIVAEVPALVDDVYKAALEPGQVRDPNAKLWVEALAKVETTPSKVLEDSGVYGWLRNELSAAFDGMGKVMRGDMDGKDLVLDLKPLKAALASDVLRNWVKEIIAHLPPCAGSRLVEWQNAPPEKRRVEELPACNPGPEVMDAAIDIVIANFHQIPDERPMFTRAEMPSGMDVPRTVSAVMWFLFIIPAFLILIGAAIADSRMRGFLRWSGIATVIGGLFPLLTSSAVQGGLLAWMKMDPSFWDFGNRTQFWTSEASRIVADRVVTITSRMVDHLFTPVTTIALVVCGVGAALFILSFLVKKQEG